MKVTPQFLISFEDTIRGLQTGNWQRVQANLYWSSLMKVRPTGAKRELLTWLLETAKIHNLANGGNKRFDDMIAATHSLEVENWGQALRLTKNEIEDNQLANNPTVGALDYARKWASDAGAAAAYHPQDQLVKLVKAGTTALGYDGVSFFNASHPVNPNGGGGVYSNIITGVPINAAPGVGQTELDAFVVAQKNFAKALAKVAEQKFFNGIPRYLKPTAMVVPTALQYRAEQLTQGDILGQTSNVLTKRNINVIVDPQFDAEPDVYYLGVEDMMSDEMGAFLYSEREPFSTKFYGPQTEAALNRMKMFEWDLEGRNTATYGHPYMFYRCTT
jgi:phage major head subunit gpT-like protein